MLCVLGQNRLRFQAYMTHQANKITSAQQPYQKLKTCAFSRELFLVQIRRVSFEM